MASPTRLTRGVHGTLKESLDAGLNMLRMGALDQARASLEQTARAFGSGLAWYYYSQTTMFTPGDPNILLMQEALVDRDASLSREDKTNFNFALGKAYLDIEDSKRAFEHLHLANRLKRSMIDYDSSSQIKWMDSISLSFCHDLYYRIMGSGINSVEPIFIIGMPRSGTSLVEHILSSHSEVHAAGELRYFFQAVKEQMSYPAGLSDLSGETVRRIAQSYMLKCGSLLGSGRRHVTDKMPYNFLTTGLLSACFPKVKIIHCRRQARDVCLSCYVTQFKEGQNFSYNLAELGTFYNAYDRLAAHWRFLITSGQMIDVVYEQVVQNTEEQISRLLDFLKLPWEENVLRFYRTRRNVDTSSAAQVRKPIYTSSINRWLKYSEHLKPLLDVLGSDTASLRHCTVEPS